MNPISRWFAPVVVAVAVSCSSPFVSAQTGSPSTPTARAATPSLYDRLGGIEPITAVVDEMLSRAGKNPVIKKRFEGANMARLREKLIEQIGEMTGGPQKYTGLDMKTSHLGMKITEREFNALAGDLQGAMAKYKVPAKEQAEIMAAVASTKGDIVVAPRPRATRDRVKVMEDSLSRLELRVAQLTMRLAAYGASPSPVWADGRTTEAPFSAAELTQVAAFKERFEKGPEQPPADEAKVLVGKPLAQTRFVDSGGLVVNLDNYTGKKKLAVVIMRGFAGAVCITCSTQLLALSANIEKIKATGAEVFVVYPGEASTLPRFLDAVNTVESTDVRGLNFLLDVDLLAVRTFDIEAALAKPSTFIIDRDGKVSYAYIGLVPADRPSVNTIIKELEKAK